MSIWKDFGSADDQQSFDVIPKGTIARVRMTIKPGGHDDHREAPEPNARAQEMCHVDRHAKGFAGGVSQERH